jgi:V8-like Glu-specific endopeptidase
MRKTVVSAAVVAICAAPTGALADAPVQQTTTFPSTQVFVSPTTGEPSVVVGEQTQRVRVHSQKDGDQNVRFTDTFRGSDPGGGTARTKEDAKIRTQNGSVTTDQKARQDVQPSGGGGFRTDRHVRTNDGMVTKDKFRARCDGQPC